MNQSLTFFRWHFSFNNNGCSLIYISLTHWGWVTHICLSQLTIIGADNGLSPGRRQAIIWTNTGILLIGPLGTNVNEISIAIHAFSFKKFHLKVSSGKWRPFCLGLNVLKFVPTVPADIAWCCTCTKPKHYMNQRRFEKTVHWCIHVTRLKWIKPSFEIFLVLACH